MRNQSASEEARQSAVWELGELERQLDAVNVREQRLRTEEAEALQRLQTAEVRSLELNDRLDRIEDILSQPPRC